MLATWAAADDGDIADLALLHLKCDEALGEPVVFIPHGDEADGPMVLLEVIDDQIGEMAEFRFVRGLAEVGGKVAPEFL